MDDRIKLYFKPQDFVCRDVWRAHGERSWRFFAPPLDRQYGVHPLGLVKPITVNTWDIVVGFTARGGLRCNLCSLVASKTKSGALYVSAHSQGMAVDFDVKGQKAEAALVALKYAPAASV